MGGGEFRGADDTAMDEAALRTRSPGIRSWGFPAPATVSPGTISAGTTSGEAARVAWLPSKVRRQAGHWIRCVAAVAGIRNATAQPGQSNSTSEAADSVRCG